MAKELLRSSRETDYAEYRTAAHWWLRLEKHGPDVALLREFSDWLTRSVAHQRAFLHVEALWLTMWQALHDYPASTPDREDTITKSAPKRAG